MCSQQEEQTLLGHILGALSDTEEREISRSLTNDSVFQAKYRKLLKSMRPLLSSRESEREEKQTREESLGLVERTMNFIRKSTIPSIAPVPAEVARDSETVMNSAEETMAQKPMAVEDSSKELAEKN